MQTLKKAESLRLEDLSSELRCPENTMGHQWVHDVKQWTTDGAVIYGHFPKYFTNIAV